MKCKPCSKITVEIWTQSKTVKITSNIFAVHTHYTLSVAIEMVHLFVLPRGSRQLCALLAAWCRLAEGV